MQRDGLDPTIMDLDPEKSVASQLDKEEEIVDKGPPLKEDPTYVKYFKMLKMVGAYHVYNFISMVIFLRPDKYAVIVITLLF